MSKLGELKKWRDDFNFQIEGINNVPLHEPNVIVANHNCIMDIFFLPMAMPQDIVSLISARLVYKKDLARQELVERYLHAMPIEAHGGYKYSKMCLDCATDMVCAGYSVGVFPEGAYVSDNVVYRGRTGASRILYASKSRGMDVNLIPVAIDINKDKIDLDDYGLSKDFVKVTILPPVDFDEYYRSYVDSDCMEVKKEYVA